MEDGESYVLAGPLNADPLRDELEGDKEGVN